MQRRIGVYDGERALRENHIDQAAHVGKSTPSGATQPAGSARDAEPNRPRP